MSSVTRFLIAAAIGFLSFVLLARGACAQSLNSVFAGVSIAENFSSASIPAYDGSTQCGVFTSGSGIMPSFFGGAGWTFRNSPIALLLQARFDNLSSTFATSPDATGNVPSAYRLTDHSYVPIDRERGYDAALSMIGVTVLGSVPVMRGLNLEGGVFGGYMARHTYRETERILSPSDAVYDENHLSQRDIGSGSISVNALQAGLAVSVRYSAHFQRDLWLQPRLEYRFPITSVSSTGSSAWRVSPVSASLALSYELSQPERVPEFTVHTWDSLIDRTPQAPPAKPVSMLAASISVLDTAGKPIVDPRLDIERTHVIEVFPMLHYVFFDDGSAEIPPRYDVGGEFVSEADLAGMDALDIHHKILDIIGSRLARNTAATVTLTGTRSEHSPADSAIASHIAGDRSTTIAQYLEHRWKISPSRIRTIQRSLPDAASDDRTATGQGENRRVEFTSNDPAITAPVTVERIERNATPPSFNFQPNILSSAGVRSATITVRQGHNILMVADAMTGDVRDEYLWKLDDRSMPRTQDSLVYELSVEDSSGAQATATGSIHLRSAEHDTYVHRSDTALDRDVHRYSLILFDYSSSQLDRKKADVLMKEMAKAVLDSSRIRLTGHTDRTGDDEFNEALARQRVERAAQMLAKRLAERGQAAHPIEIEARGSRDELFDNSVPEGRLLSRTVRAYIEKELQQ